MTQAEFSFSTPVESDPSARKHGGNRKSVAAFERIKTRVIGDQERVRVFVGGCGWNGATLKEVAKAFEKFPHQISGRFTTLKQKGLIFDSGRERESCAVYVTEKRWIGSNQ